MTRDVIIVLGKTGFGKSLWGRLYGRGCQRVWAYDPMMKYEATYIDLSTVEPHLDSLTSSQPFRYGTYLSDEIDLLGMYAYYTGDNLFVMEEASTLFTKGQRLEDWLSRLVFLGRHRRCSMLLVAQRAVSIPIDIRSQANRIICFQQHESDDLTWLGGFFNKEQLRQIPGLPKLQCFDWQDGTVSTYSIATQVQRAYGIVLDRQVQTEVELPLT